MSAVATYFRNIREAALTVFDGMSVSLSYLFRKPITVQYPDRTPEPILDMVPEGYRGILDVKTETCTACMACMRNCPVQCINIVVEKVGDPPKRMMTHFAINVAKCMFCGLCSESCPTGAIHHTKEFEGGSNNFNDLVRFFVDEPVLPYKPPKKEKPKADKPKADTPKADTSAAAKQTADETAADKPVEPAAAPKKTETDGEPT